MKRKSLISLLLVAVMTALCVLGLVLNAAAEENLVLYAVGELEIEGAIHVESIQDALVDLEENSRKWSADTTAEIRITGSSHTGGAQDGVLFGQVTIWRADGTKLPIKILGVDTAEERDAYIYLDSAGGWYACANDYTFENLTLPVGDQETFFFAGSGDVRMKNVNFQSSSDLTIENVADRTAMYQNARAAAISVCTDAEDLIVPDVGRLPCGDAWQKVRHSEEYHATGTVLTDENGEKYVDKDLTGKSGTAYGDYGHAGNTGGGQYLNACVYYEAILGLECKDNPWRPTAYELDETLVPILQKAAHDAVVEVYGEDHFKTPVDADIDDNGVINLLMMGSSSSYYMRDELHLMARHIGIDLRVVHAYSSGIKMSTQWSWANNGTGKWTVYTEWDGKTSSGVENQKLSDYVSDYPWDVIVTYETGGSFNKKKLGVSGYSDASVAKAIAFCEKTDEFINFVYSYNNNSNANARYFWFQSVAAPVGAPGPNDDAKGYLYGDNCTSAVYAGWTAEDIARYTESGKLAASSVTLGEGADYGTLISSVGYLSTVPETPLTEETAKEVKFLDCSGYEAYTVPEVLPVNTVGKIVVDGATIGAPEVHIGYSPASAILHVKAGYSGSITTCNKNSNPRYGDVSVKLTGGTIEQLDTLYNGHIVGNLSFFMDDIDGEVSIVGMLRTCFSTNSVSGDVTVDVRAGTIGGSVYPGGEAGGTVYNSFSNCAIAANFFGIRSGAAKRVVNNVCGVTVGGDFYGGHYATNALEVVENHIDGLVVDGVFCGGTYSNKTSPKITGGKVMIDGKEETLAIYNDIKNLTANGDFYGASQGGTVGAVRNDIRNITVKGVFYGGAQGSATKVASVTNNVQGGTFEGAFRGSGLGVEGDITNKISGSPTFTGVFYGSYSKLTVGNVVTEVSGTPTFSNTFNAMGYDKDSDGSEGKTLTTTIKGGTFNGSIYMSGQILRNRVATNEVTGGTFNGVFYGGSYNGVAKEILLTISGGTFETTAFCGNNYSSTSVSVGKISTTVEGGTFKGSFYGGSRGLVVGDIHTIVKGGTFKNFYGGNFSKTEYVDLTSVNSITNEFLGGTFENIFGGTRYGTVGTITNTVNGAKLVKDSEGEGGSFYGGCAGTTGSISNTIKNITTAGALIMGNDSGTLNGEINSVIENAAVQGSLNCGNDGGTMAGKIRTTIKNCNVKTYTYAAGNGLIQKPEGFAEDYLVELEILGGTFKGVWGGGSGSGTASTGKVKVTVRGGTFNLYDANSTVRQNALSAGGRNKPSSDDIDVFIYGGTFNGEVIAGACPNSSGTSYIHTDKGTHTVTIYGGTFNKPILANSKWGSVEKSKVILNPTQSDIVINSTMLVRDDISYDQNFEIIGAENKIILGASAEIEATAISGDVKFGQGATWAKRVYAALPEGNTASITVTGPHCFDRVGNSIVAVKGGIQLSAATMILTDRVAVRALFDKASVDQIDDFSFTFKMGEEVLAEGTKENLEAYGDAYYGIVLAKVGAKDFTKGVTFTGSELVWENEFSVKGLAETAETAWAGNDEGVDLAKAMQNFATIVADPTATLPHDLTPEAVDYTASGTIGTETAFTVTGKGLVMGNAVGIRIYGTCETDVTNGYFTVKVNGNDVTDLAVITKGENNGYTIDLYVHAKDMSSALKIEILEKATGNVCLELTDRVDAIAASYPEDNKLVQQLLVYIQAAVEYSKANA